MAVAALVDQTMSLDSSTDSFFHRPHDVEHFGSFPFADSRNDRWSVKLSARAASPYAGRNVVNRSLIMPVSTASHSLLSSTTTLPSLLETDDHGRIASYNSSSATSSGRTLCGQAQSFATPVSNGCVNPIIINDSASTSPSTTTSTLNSAVTDHSPVSSPQSPNSLLHSPFRHQRSATEKIGSAALNTSPPQMEQSPNDDVSPVRPSTSMSDSAALRKGRNMKNLMINTNGISARQNIDTKNEKKDPPRPSTQAGPAPTFKPGSLPAVSESAPPSPSFIIPKMPPRRKPSKLGLTISTPADDQKIIIPSTPSFGASFAARHGNPPAPLQPIPQTPAFPPALNLQKPASSNEKVLFPAPGPPGGMSFQAVTGKELRTPGLAPHGGMTLPPFGSVESSPSKRSSPGSDQYQPHALEKQRSAESVDENSEIVNHTIAYTNSVPLSDRPLSQEIKSPSYPEGPACIYPPNVFLYHQPTADEARDFDVIINVAREVTNPFEIEAEQEKARRHAKNTEPIQLAKPSYRSVGVQVELLTEDYPPRSGSPMGVPKSAASDVSFHDAMERLEITADEEAPATPRASRRQPEYIHLPWEHNSKVYEEWYEICKLIDERSKAGKKVLIHCQLGVSRSASLIVAYGIYQNPRLRPDEAREQAKQRSRWIDLNMHFMYELGDFKKLLVKKGVPGAEVSKASASHSAKSSSSRPGLYHSKTDSEMLSPVLSMPPTPMSTVSNMGSAPFNGQDSKDGQFAVVTDSGLSTPGPSSAPAEVDWTPSKQPKEPAPPLPASTREPTLVTDGSRLPAPLEAPQRQPSPALRTPGFGDMPGGWARTPADSRPQSMVFPSMLSGTSETQSGYSSNQTPTQSPTISPEPSIRSQDGDKPKRPGSIRGLPRLPSFGSGLSSIGSFFLKRSSSTASKKSRAASPASLDTTPTQQRRTSTQALTPVIRSQNNEHESPSSGLKKPPSLPSLRTMFQGSPAPHKPALNITLEPIPQSAVGHGPSDSELSAMMSPRAQEFVPSPFVRPTTSHHAMSGLTMDQHKQAEGMTSGGRKRQSLSLEEMNALNATNAAVNHLALNGIRRAGSGASVRKVPGHIAIAPADTLTNGQAAEAAVMSPGAQERDPRSPPNHGTLAKEERVLPNIGDLL